MNRNRKIKLRKSAHRAATLSLSAALAAAPVLATIPVYAADSGISKEDTVYIMADSTGNPTDTTVSSHLILDGATGAVKDSSDLEGITNIKGDETFTDADGSLVWNAAGEDIYYQGTTSKAAPVAVHMTYLLDGRKIQPAELAGKSGKLTIRVQYENTSDVTVDVDGRPQDIKTPFLMMTGLILPAETFSNITVDNGRIVNSGSSNIVLGYGMPGLKESLRLEDLEDALDDTDSDDKTADSDGRDNSSDSRTSDMAQSSLKNSDARDDAEQEDDDLDIDFDTDKLRNQLRDTVDELKLSDTFEINADVTDFSIGSTYTFAMSDLFTDLDTADFMSVDDINEAMDAIKEAGTKLVDGSGELFDGTTELKDGYGELDDGIKTLHDGVGELASGSGTLKDGVSQYVSGVNTLAGGITSYLDGVDQVSAGISSLSDLQKGIDQLKSGIAALSANAGSDSELMQGVTSLNSGMQQLQKAANAIDVEKISQLVNASKGSLDAAGVNLAQTIQDFEGLEATRDQLNDLISMIDTLESGIEQLQAAENGIYQNAIAIADSAAKSLSDSLSKIDVSSFNAVTIDQISTISINIDGYEGLTDEQKNALKDEINRVNNEITSANEKITTANAANSALAEGARNAVSTTTNGAIETASGISSTIQSKLGPYDEQVAEGVSQIKAQLDAVKQQTQAVSSKLDNVINSSSYQALKAQLPELKSTLNGLISSDPLKQLGTLQSSVNQLANGTSSLKKSLDEKLVPGIQQLNDGANKLSSSSSSGISALQNGVKQLTANNGKLRSGSAQVQKAGKQLFEGADALVNGIEQLQTGSGKLSSGSDDVRDGIDALNDGADQLHAGLLKLDEKGIRKISDLVQGDLTDLFDRVKAVSSEDAVYSNFSGAADGMDSTVKFVIQTESIGQD